MSNIDKFRKLGIMEPILKVIDELGFTEPREIQEKTIPLVLKGKDIVAGSATGSGKTLAFGSGIIQNCEKNKGIQALVLTPTRELAEQVAESLRDFSQYKYLNITSVYGGVSISNQIRRLRNTDVVVGTPGRMLDHIGRRTINLSKVKILVLDEADVMLDMGFIDDVEQIMKACPKTKQALMFSATITKELEKLSHRYMNNPEHLFAETYVDAKKLRQVFYVVKNELRLSLLFDLLKNEKSGLVMVFCNSRRNTDFVANNLSKNGIDSVAIHGGLTQSRRSQILGKFNDGKTHVLVCTDVAARGLDIVGVSHVYNYDIPKDAKQYIHRIGRTARAGKEGIAVNLLSQQDFGSFQQILRENEVEIEELETPFVERIEIKWRPEVRRKQFGRRQKPGRGLRSHKEYGKKSGGSRPTKRGKFNTGKQKHHNKFRKKINIQKQNFK